MKSLILLSGGLVLSALTATAQMERPGGPPTPPFGGEVPEEVQALHSEIDALRDSLRTSRDAVIAALGEDPSREAIMAAVAAWETENAATLEEVEALATELRALIQANRPEDVTPPEISDEALQAREELKTRRQALADSRRATILALGEDPTDEAVRAAIEAWRTENADEISAVEALAAEIRDVFRGARPDRAGPQMDAGMAARREGFRENARALKENRKALREQMQDPNLTPGERRTLLQQFREDQKEILQARREMLREKRAAEAGAGGDRRPGG